MSAESDRKRNEFRDSLRKSLFELRSAGVPESEIASLGDRIERAAAETKESELGNVENSIRQELANARTQGTSRRAQEQQAAQATEQKAAVGKEIDLQSALTNIVGQFGSLTPQETALAITRLTSPEAGKQAPEALHSGILTELGGIRQARQATERARVEEEFGKFSGALASEEDIARSIGERTTAGFAGSPLLQSGAFQSALAQGAREAAMRRAGTLAQARGGLEQGLTAQQLATFRGSQEAEQSRAIGARQFPFQAAAQTRELELSPFQTALAGDIRQEDFLSRIFQQELARRAQEAQVAAAKRGLLSRLLKGGGAILSKIPGIGQIPGAIATGAGEVGSATGYF